MNCSFWFHFGAAVAVAMLPASRAANAVSQLDGVIDLHCHSGPDTVARSVNDLQLARLALAAGMRGIVLKNHYTSTAGRAQLVMQELMGIEVFGGIVLNRAVGGINPEAVRRMIETEGGRGRIVWLPTIDSENQVGFAKEKRAFVPVVRQGAVVPELEDVFALIAQHDLVLATGHSSAEECLVVIAAAKQAGVKKILVTHALAEAIGATEEKLGRLASLGAVLECTWLTHAPGTGGAINVGRAMPVADGVRLMRIIGFEHFALSSDYGQSQNPVPPEGMRAYLSALQSAGVSPQQIDVMARRNPARLLGLE